MNVDKLKEARKKVEKAQEKLDKVKSDAKKEYMNAVAEARKDVENLQKEYAQVTEETREELRKAGIKVVDDDVVIRRTYVYPDLHPDMQDLMDLNIPLWIAPLWQKKYPTYPPYRQTNFRWTSTSNTSSAINEPVKWQSSSKNDSVNLINERPLFVEI